MFKPIFCLVLAAKLLSFTAIAAPCYNIGDKVKMYGIVDNFHFFHAGNGMHVSQWTIRAMESFCVTGGIEAEETHASFQLFIETDSMLKSLKDGMLVDLEGTYMGFGDTAWYTNYPVLNHVVVTKVYMKDPHDVE